MTSPLRATSTTPKRETFSGIDGQRRQGDIRAGIVVLLQHLAIVHLVDVVAGEDQHVLRLLGADGVNVLVDSVCRAHVPVGADALHGRKNLNELAQFLGHDAGPSLRGCGG